MVEQISFLLNPHKFSINMHLAKKVHTGQSETFYEQAYLERDYEEI